MNNTHFTSAPVAYAKVNFPLRGNRVEMEYRQVLTDSAVPGPIIPMDQVTPHRRTTILVGNRCDSANYLYSFACGTPPQALRNLIGRLPSTREMKYIPNNSVIFYAGDNNSVNAEVITRSGQRLTFPLSLVLRFIDTTSERTVADTIVNFMNAVESHKQIGLLNIDYNEDENLKNLQNNECSIDFGLTCALKPLEDDFFVNGLLNIGLLNQALLEIKSSQKSFESKLKSDARYYGYSSSIPHKIAGYQSVIERLEHLSAHPEDIDAFEISIVPASVQSVLPDESTRYWYSYTNFARNQEVLAQIRVGHAPSASATSSL